MSVLYVSDVHSGLISSSRFVSNVAGFVNLYERCVSGQSKLMESPFTDGVILKFFIFPWKSKITSPDVESLSLRVFIPNSQSPFHFLSCHVPVGKLPKSCANARVEPSTATAARAIIFFI